jgi:ABC-type glycerol-3-phosphate transport system substrate-binding protein
MGELVNGVWRYHDPVTITAMYSYNPARIREEDVARTWMLEYARHEMNIHIDTILYTTEQAGTVLPLLMASGDYADAFLFFMYGLNGTGNHSRWGDQEQILIPLNNWLFNREVMPNVSRILLDEFPADVPSLATATGNIYQIPTVLQHMEFAINMSNQYLWYDTRVLSALGMAVPTTVYEFRNFLLAVRDQDPKGLGRNNIPMGGRHSSFNPWAPFLNAFGFVHGDPRAMVSLVGGRYIDGPGELVPLQTHPNYFAFLQYMHSLHADGLFELDFFTQEAAQATAKANQDHYAVWPAFNPNEFNADSALHYHVIPPMTSSVNNVQLVNTGASQLGGNYQIFLTDKASELQQEAMMRFADRAYDYDFRWAAYNGPRAGIDDDYGLNLTGWHFDANGVIVQPDLTNGRFEVRGDLLWAVSTFNDSGNAFDRRTDGRELNNLDTSTVTGHWHNQVVQNQIPYLVRSIPGFTPREADVAFMNEMWTVLTDLMTTALAQFVTGARPVTEAEFAAYGRELAAAGYDEYVRIFMETLNDTYGK